MSPAEDRFYQVKRNIKLGYYEDNEATEDMEFLLEEINYRENHIKELIKIIDGFTDNKPGEQVEQIAYEYGYAR